MREVECYPLLSREEEFALAVKHWETGDISAAHSLVNSNLRFVVRIAKSYAGYKVSLTDLIQEGALGLMTAIKKFNPHRGYRLISYAIWWIRARIHEHIMRFWSSVRIGSSRNERKLFQKIPAARRALSGIETEPEKLSAMLGVSAREIAEMEMRTSARDFSLDSEVGENQDAGSYLELVADTTPSQETVLEESQNKEWQKTALNKALEALDEREREIITSRCLTEAPVKLGDLGKKFGVSAERIRQIENNAISKMKRLPSISMAKTEE